MNNLQKILLFVVIIIILLAIAIVIWYFAYRDNFNKFWGIKPKQDQQQQQINCDSITSCEDIKSPCVWCENKKSVLYDKTKNNLEDIKKTCGGSFVDDKANCAIYNKKIDISGSITPQVDCESQDIKTKALNFIQDSYKNAPTVKILNIIDGKKVYNQDMCDIKYNMTFDSTEKPVKERQVNRAMLFKYDNINKNFTPLSVLEPGSGCSFIDKCSDLHSSKCVWCNKLNKAYSVYTDNLNLNEVEKAKFTKECDEYVLDSSKCK